MRERAIDLTVAQVLHDNALLIEGGLPPEWQIDTPAKLEIWRYADDRMVEIGRRLGRYVQGSPPRLGWEPVPDERVFTQILDRLNPWLRQSHPKSEWSADPLLQTLPDELRNADDLEPYVSAEALARPTFERHEMQYLQQAVWLRDISEWARGEGFDDLEQATALFDWTIRNIQLDDDDDYRPRQPWQILLYGHGTAAQRAWIFALLCRQQNLDVVVLTVPAEDTKDCNDGESRFWLPALVHDRQLCLFDTRLGLPLPGPGGAGIATLQQLQETPDLLDALDVGDLEYPIASDQLNDVTANVVASYFALTRRAILLEGQLTGNDATALTMAATEQAKRLAKLPGIAAARIWPVPFTALLGQLNMNEQERH